MYVLWREVESSFDRSGSFHEFSAVVNESTTKVFNFLRGGGGRSRYTSDQLHGWSCLLTRHWISDGYQVHVILHPGGQIEPVVSQFEVGSQHSGGSK